MSEQSRKAGRLSRTNRSAEGRERLIEATREYLRQKGPVDLPRKQLATAARVVPALVAYHFPNDLLLVEAAARPIIDGYLARLISLLAIKTDRLAVLRALILLLLEIARDNEQLIDTYVAFAKQNRVAVADTFLIEAFKHITAFFEGCEADGVLASQNHAFAQTALWGICKTTAQQRELAAMMTNGDGADGVAARQADMILQFFVRGPITAEQSRLKPPLRTSANVPRPRAIG